MSEKGNNKFLRTTFSLCKSRLKLFSQIIQVNFISFSINIVTLHQSGALFVGERVFQNHEVMTECWRAFPRSPHHPRLCQVFAFAQISAMRGEKLFACTTTLARQAMSHLALIKALCFYIQKSMVFYLLKFSRPSYLFLGACLSVYC